jgi:hypothetical protein
MYEFLITHSNPWCLGWSCVPAPSIWGLAPIVGEMCVTYTGTL